MNIIKISTIVIITVISGCNATVDKKETIRNIDITYTKNPYAKVFIKPKTKSDIRKAYSDYLKFASKKDKSRLDAINRLAELEFETSNKIQKENESLQAGNNEELDDKLYNERLEKTIKLLSTSLNDYPNAKGNDKILYQLAKAYDHKGDSDNSEINLQQLVTKYPKSRYYIESQFRIAEILFSKRNYIKAEDTYTDIIGSRKNNIFYEKALFKRGWSRFKQEYYLEAVDDYLEAVDYHNFKDHSELTPSQLRQFNEYFRAIGLSFSYLGGAEALNDYFKSNPNFKYIFYSYSHVSDIYLKQQRYSDAVETLKFFIKNNKNSNDIPTAYLKVVNIWKVSGFAKKAATEIEVLYSKYHPNSKYWLSRKSSGDIYNKVSSSLKNNILLASSYYHKLYQKNSKELNFKMASKWYKRYIQHYSSSARKNNIFYQYADLLKKHKQYNKALKYYELAAYDGDLILNKKAAYATISLTDKLYNLKTTKLSRNILNKHIKYATLYTQLYPTSKQAPKIILHASELAFQTKQYDKAIELADSIASYRDSSNHTKANIIKAHSYFKSNQFENAEAAYLSAYSSKYIGHKSKPKLMDKIALSIYKQAETANENGAINKAIEHFFRISDIAPSSSIAATGLYDAIALSMRNKFWDISIHNINKFKKMYPKSKHQHDITKKLSIAYLESNQNIKAAQEFERLSRFEKDKNIKIAALWQAAELYESNDDIHAAIRSYEKFYNKYKKPFPQYMESMNKLTELYTKLNNKQKTSHWQKIIIKEDKKAINKHKTDRTRYITSFSSLNLAKSEHKKYTSQKLILPLNISLRKKKYVMQKAVKYYGQASKYGVAETATESTNAIADIYKSFSESLLSSQKPKGLSTDELEQYVILLEDKAFPFEDKAIEFYEANMSHIKDGIYNKWVKQSHAQLRSLFPTRYKRTAKLDRLINEIH